MDGAQSVVLLQREMKRARLDDTQQERDRIVYETIRCPDFAVGK